MKKILKYILFSLLITISASAQINPEPEEEEHSIEVIGKSFLDSVVIRWAPSTSDLWLAGNAYGYRIVRKMVGIGDSLFINYPIVKELTLSPVRPLPVEAIEPMASYDMYPAIVAQAIYGETFNVVSQSSGNLINKASEINNRYSFSLFACDVSRNAAIAHGLMYIDKDITPNAHYLYSICLASENSLVKGDTALLYIQVTDTFTLPEPVQLSANTGDRIISLKWRKKVYDKIFTAYIVERSEDGKVYQQRNANPMVNLMQGSEKELEYNFFVDSVISNEKTYIYRVRGISALGEISPPSDTIHVKGSLPMYMLNPMISATRTPADGTVEIEWEVPYADSIHLKGFSVLRSDRADGTYSYLSDIELLKPQQHHYTDKEPLTSGYYIVESVDELNRKYQSFPAIVLLPDSIPPAPPKGLAGMCDSTGVISLKWNANSEPDLAGYKVFRLNNPKDNPMKINASELMFTEFYDTLSLNTLTSSFFYTVAAYDKHYNQSAFAEIIEVKLYDTIPPAAIVFSGYKVSEEKIWISWHPSPASDLEKYLLYREADKSGQWQLIASFFGTTEFTDSTYTKPSNRYILSCLDASGNESSPSQILAVDALKPQTYEMPVLKLKKEDDQSFRINIESERKDIVKILIYRSVNESPYTLLKTIFSAESKITDANLKIGNTYGYRIQLVFSDGTKSKISDPVKAKII